ncbi:MAG TPA: MFS transporter [Conexibacter sp.]|nr:MFS transporter [Conexibacter sp.]
MVADVNAPRAPGIGRGLIVLLAVACGATVANLYYAQPLLPTIADAFGVREGTAGLLVTVTQLSYAAGLLFVVPLGDLLDRRRLVMRLLILAAAGLAVAAVAPAFALLAVALGVAALSSVVVQILIPFASTLADPAERGRVIGTIMSGVLTGILLARTASGLIAGVAGWEAPFVVAAVAMLALAIALWRALPAAAPPSTLPYGRLLASILALVRDEPLLRRRMVYGACGYAAFSIVWTAVAFLLAGPPYHYSQTAIGLFGLAGVVGAVGAQGFGRLHDRGSTRPVTGAMLALILVGWALLAFGGASILAVVAGLVVLDFGVQGQHVLNQGTIYALGSEHASRVTSAYVTGNFIGGAVGSAAASVAWSVSGWDGVCAVGAVVALGGLAFWATELRRPRALARARRTMR